MPRQPARRGVQLRDHPYDEILTGERGNLAPELFEPRNRRDGSFPDRDAPEAERAHINFGEIQLVGHEYLSRRRRGVGLVLEIHDVAQQAFLGYEPGVAEAVGSDLGVGVAAARTDAGTEFRVLPFLGYGSRVPLYLVQRITQFAQLHLERIAEGSPRGPGRLINEIEHLLERGVPRLADK